MITAFGLDNFEQYRKNNPFMDYNHIELVEVTEERCVVKLELRPESLNLNGYVHGGLIYSLADCVSGILSRTNGTNYITLNGNLNFIRNVNQGTIYSDAVIIRRGRRTCVERVRVYDENETVLADGTITMISAE